MITIHNNMKIYHNHFQVLCVRCIKTGKFLKHAQAKRVLFTCVLMNVLAVGYTVLWSIIK